MLDSDVRPETAEAVFRRKFRQKLAARGYQGPALDRKVDELMDSPVRFTLDLTDDASATVARLS
jgi:hypothetical protein